MPTSSIVSFCACWFSPGFSRLSRAHEPQKAEPSNTMATITRTVVSVMFISFVGLRSKPLSQALCVLKNSPLEPANLPTLGCRRSFNPRQDLGVPYRVVCLA